MVDSVELLKHEEVLPNMDLYTTLHSLVVQPRRTREGFLVTLPTSVLLHQGSIAFLVCTVALFDSVLSDEPSDIFGEKLREQVEERLNFFSGGKVPRKSIDVMKEALQEAAKLKKEQEKSQKKEDKSQKKRKREEETPEVPAEEPKKKKKKKDKKAKKEKKEGEEAPTPMEVVSGDQEKKDKKKKKKKDKKDKKKKKKEGLAAS